MKKKLYTLMLAAALLAGLSLTTASAAEVSFTDTSGHWAEQAIASVVEKELFNGTSETTFSPDISMDRGMFVTVLGRFAGKMGAEVSGTAVFDDVSADAYYAPYVAWAADQGIVKGTSETTFSPADPVTREQMCALFIRLLQYAKYEIPTGTELAFTDEAQISDYAKENVQNAVALGLIKGIETADGMAFCPADSATRAQVATVFLRLDGLEGIYDALKPSEDPTPVDPTPEDPTPVDPTPVNPTPVDPTPVNPTPVTPSDDVTDEEKELEAEIAEYLATMLEKYDNMTYLKETDQIVRDCMEIITSCMRDALKARENGTFLSEDFINKTYASDIEEAKALYRTMSDDQKSQMDNVAVRMAGTWSQLTTVLNYFGFNIV